jgi:hypothetical protein
MGRSPTRGTGASPEAATTPALTFIVATDAVVTPSQTRCIDRLSTVPGVELVGWFQPTTSLLNRESVLERDGAQPSAVPSTLANLPRFRTLDALRTHPLSDRPIDVCLDLTERGLTNPPACSSERWRFRYGDGLQEDAAHAALVGYVRGPSVTRVALVSEPRGAVLREGWLQSVSWWNGRPVDRLHNDTEDWPALVAQEWTGGTSASNGGSGDSEHERSMATSSTSVGATRAANVPRPLLVVGAVGRRMRGAVDVLSRHPDWNIGILSRPIQGVLDDGDLEITWLPLRPDRFAADPFGVVRGGVLHVLFEDYDQRSGRGVISHVAVDAAGRVSDASRVLDAGVHASYPYLVEDDGAIYMLPETGDARRLTLYEAVEFPYRWRAARTLLEDVPAVDASVVKHDGTWWMFATRIDRGANQNLFIWHAPRLTGPWTAHAANPVKTDARSARSGGTPFVADGRLYRPSQDNSRIYGGQLVLNRVDVLTPTVFSETRVKTLEPRRAYPDGLHTLSAVGDRTLIDGNRRHLVVPVLRRNIESKVPMLSRS